MYLPDSSISAIANTTIANTSIAQAKPSIAKASVSETPVAKTSIAKSSIETSESPEAIPKTSKTKSGFGVSLCISLSLRVCYPVLCHEVIGSRPLAITIAVTIAVLVSIAMSVAVTIGGSMVRRMAIPCHKEIRIIPKIKCGFLPAMSKAIAKSSQTKASIAPIASVASISSKSQSGLRLRLGLCLGRPPSQLVTKPEHVTVIVSVLLVMVRVVVIIEGAGGCQTGDC